MGELFNLKATNGDCIADYGDALRRLRLHCVEELGNDCVQSKSYTSIWIPVDSKNFWSMIKSVCDKNANSGITGDNAKREYQMLSKVIENLMKELED